mgnify:CR=1 FL=1
MIADDLKAIGLYDNDELIEKYVLLVNQFIKWNRIHNLSAHRTRRAIEIYQLIDSLTVHEYIRPGTCLDIGTGPGFP